MVDINKIDVIDQVLETAKRVFNPTQKELAKYHKREDWIKKVDDGGLLLSISQNSEVVAFTICEKRSDSLHIWNVGVLPDYRKQGLWKQMLDVISSYAKENGYKKITLNTYRSKFPAMYEFVKNNGYEEFVTEFDQKQKIIKSCFEKDLT